VLVFPNWQRVSAALSGELFGRSLQQPITLVLLASLMVVLIGLFVGVRDLAAVTTLFAANSAMILFGLWRWLAALALAGFTLIATFVALRFWEIPAGQGRMMAMNAFFEHLGLIGGFILVAIDDLTRTKDSARDGQR